MTPRRASTNARWSTGFSGVAAIVDETSVRHAAAHGEADRAHAVPNTVDTRFAIASGTKGFTALTIMRLVETGVLELTTPVRSVLGADLPSIGDTATVEQLLAHRSGIGDYLDEAAAAAIEDYVLPVPVHTLGTLEAWIPVLDHHPAAFAPDERFAYNNAGYVVLALVAERAGGAPFAALVAELVCGPAGLTNTGFVRSDDPAPDLAIGYLDDGRTNLLHLPVLGGGDGGLASTAGDIDRFWRALFAGAIVEPRSVAAMTHPRSDVPAESMRYGLGFWLHSTGPAVMLEGCDPGISFRSVYDPERRFTHTVLGNTTDGAWPITRLLDEITADP